MIYKDSKNQLHEIEPEFAHLLPADCVPITEEEASAIQAENEAIRKAEYEASLTYVEKRQQAYPSYADQLDKIFHFGIDAWKADIQAIKDSIPKDNV